MEAGPCGGGRWAVTRRAGPAPARGETRHGTWAQRAPLRTVTLALAASRRRGPVLTAWRLGPDGQCSVMLLDSEV